MGRLTCSGSIGLVGFRREKKRDQCWGSGFNYIVIRFQQNFCLTLLSILSSYYFMDEVTYFYHHKNNTHNKGRVNRSVKFFIT